MAALELKTARVFLPLLKPSRYKGIWGGRGSGKSHFFAERAIELGIDKKLDIVCLRETQRSLEFSVKKLLEAKISAMNAGYYYEVQDRRIKSINGGTIIFEGMQNHTNDSIKSLEGFDIAWFEEAQVATQKSLDLLRPTLRKEGSELWFGWNPDLPTDPVEKLLRSESPPKDSIVVNANYYDNPFLPDVLRKEVEYDKRDQDKYSHIWLGGYRRNSASRIFNNWRVEEFDVQDDWLIRQGADWGYSIDPSTLVQCAIVGRNLYIPYEAYKVGCEIDALPDLLLSVPDSERWPIVADSARPETISYMQRHGFPKIMPAIKGKRSIEEGIEFLKSFDIIVHPRCVHMARELSLYSYKTDRLTGAVLPIVEDKNNNMIDALRYACESARRLSKPKNKFEFLVSSGSAVAI